MLPLVAIENCRKLLVGYVSIGHKEKNVFNNLHSHSSVNNNQMCC